MDRLYDYIVRRLAEANAQNEPAMLEEVTHLLGEIKGGWDAISAAERQVAKTPSGAPVAVGNVAG